VRCASSLRVLTFTVIVENGFKVENF